ncbi:hypothetical protein LIER_18071 [Lithospermum erythrorhizon]|uniref:Thaumatin-like protein n=1 Tax=Lithospermum erythrorhizon TaxID=34254 RepID=A0AAV3QF83_LITER
MAFKILFHALFLSFFVLGIHAITVKVRNNCNEKIWPATLTSSGGAPSTTGFELASKAEGNIELPGDWSGRIWARTGCSGAGTGCATGECGSGSVTCNGNGGVPPVSLVEITLPGGDSKTQNFYDISLVDGFNLPVKVSPDGCRSISCQADINNQVCPADLRVPGPNGGNIACKSACLQTNSDSDCCKGAFNSPDKCSPSEYSKVVKQACPDAYSYAYDDRTSTATCPTGANYLVEFC